MRKKIITYALAFFAAAAVLSGGKTATVFAAGQKISAEADLKLASAPTGKISDLKQTGATTSSVDIQFGTLLSSEVQYAVLVGTGESNVSAEALTTSGGLATITGLASGSTYYVKVVPFREDTEVKDTEEGEQVTSVVRTYGTASAVIAVATVPSDTPGTIRQTASGTDSITVSWSAVSGASGYYVDYMMSESTSQEKQRITTSALTAELTGLSATKSYTVTVTPYRIGAGGFYAYDSSLASVKTGLSLAAAVSGKPSGTVKNLAQKTAGTDGAEITFTLLSDKNAQYSVQISKSKKSGFSECATVSEGSYAFTGLDAGSSYYVRIVPFYQKWNSFNEEYERTYGTASKTLEIVTVPESKPKAITQTAAAKTGFTISWDEVDGANGYLVDYYLSGDTKKTTVKTKKTSLKLTGLSANREYNVYVTPYRKSAEGFVAVNESNYTGQYNIPVRPSKASAPTAVKYWQSIGKVNVKTKNIACADGYQYVLYTADGDNAKKVKSIFASSASSADISSAKLKKNTLFQVKVRAYILVQGKKVYGAWSDWTYIGVSPKTTLTKSGQTIHASWEKVTYADRYVVYISDDKTSGYKKCFVTKKTSCDITSYGKSAIRSGSRYYVYVVPQVEVNGVCKNAAKRDKVAETD